MEKFSSKDLLDITAFTAGLSETMAGPGLIIPVMAAKYLCNMASVLIPGGFGIIPGMAMDSICTIFVQRVISNHKAE